jgi:hypothetical protein
MPSPELTLILRILRRRVGDLPEALQLSLNDLSDAQLSALTEEVLDFTTLADVANWLANLPDHLPNDPLGR